MLEELVADARERGDPWIVGRLFFLAEVEVLSGDWDPGSTNCATRRWSSHARRAGTTFFRCAATSSSR